MKPAISVILLTTLIGVGQGMFAALYCAGLFAWVEADNQSFFLYGCLASLLFLGAGLIASFFHLGRPERAWRAAAMWRTSWLSREVIALPVAMVAVAACAGALYAGYAAFNHGVWSATIGTIGMLAVLVLFLCTGMIYACIRFLQEWATPLTVVNFTLLGLSSGFVLTAAHAARYAPEATESMVKVSLTLLLSALIFKLASLRRNQRIKPRASVQTAIGIRHNRINQQSVGFMGGSFNTREFFHGKSPWVLDAAMRLSLLLLFLLPAVLLVLGLNLQLYWIPASAFVVHYLGQLLERWHFFAQAQHPQNFYYQAD